MAKQNEISVTEANYWVLTDTQRALDDVLSKHGEDVPHLVNCLYNLIESELQRRNVIRQKLDMLEVKNENGRRDNERLDENGMKRLLQRLDWPHVFNVSDYGGSWHVWLDKEPNAEQRQRLKDAGYEAHAMVEYKHWRIPKPKHPVYDGRRERDQEHG